MTVTCPECETRYRLPARSKLGAHPTFRCTRCNHSFSPEEEAEEPVFEPQVAADDDEPEVDDEEQDDEEIVVGEAVRDDEEDESEEEPDERPRRRRAKKKARAAAEPPPATGTSPARFAIRSLLAVTLAYGVLSIYLYTHPTRVGELAGSLPVVGDQLTEVRVNPAHIQLADLHGTYARVHGDRLVFVISGTAINNAPVPVNGVQIQGRIAGAEELRQTVFAGAAPRDVQDLSVREIDLLQTLTPSKDWALAPGEQSTFLVAFVSPPVPLREFSAEVVAVRRGPRGDDRTAAR